MKIVLVILLVLALSGCNSKPEADYRLKIDDNLRSVQVKDMKFGMFICWSFSTFSGSEWTPTLDKDASYFKATEVDTDQWCQAGGQRCLNELYPFFVQASRRILPLG